MQWLPLLIAIKYPLNIQFMYYGLCVVVAFLGNKRPLGFWGFLFFSVLFSPVMGLFIVLVTRKTKKIAKKTKS